MATFESFDCFSSDLILGRHNFLKDEFRVMLTNTRPVKELSSLKSITHLELPSSRNYKAGGKRVRFRLEDTVKRLKVFITTDPKWIKKYRDSIGPFRYVVIYNRTNELPIGYYDYGGSIVLNKHKESFTACLSSTRDKRGRLLPTLIIHKWGGTKERHKCQQH